MGTRSTSRSAKVDHSMVVMVAGISGMTVMMMMMMVVVVVMMMAVMVMVVH